MFYKLTSLKWWFTGVNPAHQFGWLPTLVWLTPVVCAFLYFAPWEYIGVRRINGFVPFTWFVECLPPSVLVFIFTALVWHFILHNWPLGRP